MGHWSKDLDNVRLGTGLQGLSSTRTLATRVVRYL